MKKSVFFPCKDDREESQVTFAPVSSVSSYISMDTESNGKDYRGQMSPGSSCFRKVCSGKPHGTSSFILELA